MPSSIRTPEGHPFRCPVCGEDTDIERTDHGDACCPACGSILWWFRDRIDERVSLQHSLKDVDSIDFVELVMQLEEEYGINLSEAATEEIETIEDAIRMLRRKREERD